MRKLQQMKEAKQKDLKVAQKMAQQASDQPDQDSTTTNINSDWEKQEGKVVQSYKLGDTPKGLQSNTPGRMNRWDMTPVGFENKTPGRNVFGETPTPGRTNQI